MTGPGQGTGAREHQELQHGGRHARPPSTFHDEASQGAEQGPGASGVSMGVEEEKQTSGQLSSGISGSQGPTPPIALVWF